MRNGLFALLDLEDDYGITGYISEPVPTREKKNSTEEKGRNIN